MPPPVEATLAPRKARLTRINKKTRSACGAALLIKPVVEKAEIALNILPLNHSPTGAAGGKPTSRTTPIAIAANQK